MKHTITESTKTMVDAASVITVLGTLLDMIPSIAAIFTIVWTGIRIWETDTVRKWTGREKKEADAKQDT